MRARKKLDAKLKTRVSETPELESYDMEANDHLTLNELIILYKSCLLYTSPSPRDATLSRMPSSA